MKDRWIYRRGRPGARMRLFCFPYAGAGAGVYSGWQNDFTDVEICAVELPGRRGRLREEPIRRAGPLVEALAEGLAPYLDLPFAFFGHSMGALLAFEVARRLRRDGHAGPRALLLSGLPAPHLPVDRRPIWDLPDAAFVGAIRAYDATPDEVFHHPELLALVLPALRADFEVLDTYVHRPEAPLSCPTRVYGGAEDERVRPAQLAAWRDLVSGPVPVQLFPGGHFYLKDDRTPLTSALARELRLLAGAVGPA